MGGLERWPLLPPPNAASGCADCITCTEVDVWKKCTELMNVATQFLQILTLV